MKRTGVILVIATAALAVLAWTSGLAATLLTAEGGEPIWEAVAWWAFVPTVCGFIVAVICTFVYFDNNL